MFNNQNAMLVSCSFLSGFFLIEIKTQWKFVCSSNFFIFLKFKIFFDNLGFYWNELDWCLCVTLSFGRMFLGSKWWINVTNRCFLIVKNDTPLMRTPALKFKLQTSNGPHPVTGSFPVLKRHWYKSKFFNYN